MVRASLLFVAALGMTGVAAAADKTNGRMTFHVRFDTTGVSGT